MAPPLRTLGMATLALCSLVAIVQLLQGTSHQMSPGSSASSTRAKMSHYLKLNRPLGRPHLRRMEFSEAFSNAAELPEAGQWESFSKELEESCWTTRRPPLRLSVAGMPNSGTNALARYLKANLAVEVEDGLSGPELWKHLMPFHPQFSDFLSQECSSPIMWNAVVFTVRNPLTWMLSQTSPGHDYGHMCGQSPNGPACVFETCQWSDPATCDRVPPPQRWRFPTLLDLWAAYAMHLPSMPTVIVVRYEDLLRDREAVLRRVIEHFRLGTEQRVVNAPDPLQSYTRHWELQPSSTGLAHSQERLRSFERFWGQYGVAPFGPRPSPGQTSSGAVGHGGIQCPAGDLEHLVPSEEHVLALGSVGRRKELLEALRMHGYELPTPKQAHHALKACGQGNDTGKGGDGHMTN